MGYAKKKWTINNCRERGGWAPNEDMETLIKYCCSWNQKRMNSMESFMNDSGSDTAITSSDANNTSMTATNAKLISIESKNIQSYAEFYPSAVCHPSF